ncbi:uncharacterized protein Z520_04290 [Fonsecaea multimorphosa CBS 102226]|uniref:USP domain-containing protein n=1 Tax=Fonsecaea multimorphosa CBS 102226 TaxID=1442371 RepID=A0A0D2HCM7_9EURO|nr:uncharacterized protein Z520_04290 [Fonsecaea multimorphosa CBS 102226]KIX99655.1 hypothetical protein Z520_04290 [Fonsecaea multimorphosa CBS 102226]OAL26707.1 hypothetical protein AYO22_04060 [Fonsecaea multimorphosa]
MVQTRAQVRAQASALGQASTSNATQNVAAQNQANSKPQPKGQAKRKTPAKRASKVVKPASQTQAKHKPTGKRRARPNRTGWDRPKVKKSSKKKDSGKKTTTPAAANDVGGAQGSAANPPPGTAAPPPQAALPTGNGPIPSPTTSEGPEFETPLRASEETIAAARLEESSNVGKGFRNPGRLCYRNAIIVMLLHNNRLMSWIENRHIPNLVGAGLRVKPYSTPLIDALLGFEADAEAAISLPIDYTDVWCELFDLSRAYWDESHSQPKTLYEAMDIFWNYATNPRRDVERSSFLPVEERPTTKMKAATEDQDAHEFLTWLIELSVDQLNYFTEEKVLENKLDQATLDKVIDLARVNINELVQVTQTVRNRCTQCGSTRNVKIRALQLDEEKILSLPLAATTDRSVPVTLEDCFAKNSNPKDGGDWRCENCNIGAASSNQNRANGGTWKNICVPPEVLFVHLVRFKIQRGRKGTFRWTKDSTEVTIPEELDLTPFLEKRGEPANISAKYRLQAVVNHQGSRNEGHYIGAARRGDGWYVFNDGSTVKKTSLSDILSHKDGFTPYVLLYEKAVDDNEIEDEDPGAGDDANPASGADGAGDDAGARKTGNRKGDNNKRKRKEKNNADSSTQRTGRSQAPANGAQAGLQQTSSAQIKVAMEKDPRPCQLFIHIRACIGQYEIYFPTFALENYVPNSSVERGGYFAVQTMDAAGNTMEMEGSASVQSAAQGEKDYSIILLEPTRWPGWALWAERGARLGHDGVREEFMRSMSEGTELDPDVLPNVPTYSPSERHPPTTHAAAGFGMPGHPPPPRATFSPGASRQRSQSVISNNNGIPAPASSPTTRDLLHAYKTEIVRLRNQLTETDDRHQRTIAALTTKVAKQEELLEMYANGAVEVGFYWQSQEDEWKGREAKLNAKILKLQGWNDGLTEALGYCRREHRWTHNLNNPCAAEIGLGIQGVDYPNTNATEQGTGPGEAAEVGAGAGAGAGAGQKRTFDQVAGTGEDGAQARATKRVKFATTNTSNAQAEAPSTEQNQPLPADIIDYDDRRLTDLHYDSAGNPLYSDESEDDDDDSEDGGEDGDDVVPPRGQREQAPEPEDIAANEDEDDTDDEEIHSIHHEESPLPDYEDMVPEDERYDASAETSPYRMLYSDYAAARYGSRRQRFPSTPTPANRNNVIHHQQQQQQPRTSPRTAPPPTGRSSRPSPIQTRHTQGLGRVDGRVRSSPQYYQTGTANSASKAGEYPYGCQVHFDEDGVPHYTPMWMPQTQNRGLGIY